MATSILRDEQEIFGIKKVSSDSASRDTGHCIRVVVTVGIYCNTCLSVLVKIRWTVLETSLKGIFLTYFSAV